MNQLPNPEVADEARPDEDYDLTVGRGGGEATAPSPAAIEENVFRVLATRARARKSVDLWFVAIGGAVDAGLLWWQHPLLSWLAAGCAATAAYGVWGLLDRAVDRQRVAATAPEGTRQPSRGRFEQLTGLRDVTAVLGTGAAAWAVLSFLGVALRNWNH